MGKRHRMAPSMVHETMQLVVFQDHNYTSMVIVDDGGNVIGMGEAKRDPHDDVNLEIGGVLAMGRAFEDVARHALKRADGLIRHADNLRDAKADAKFVREEKGKRAVHSR